MHIYFGNSIPRIHLVLSLKGKRTRLGDEVLVDSDLLAALLAVSGLLDPAKRRLRGGRVTRVHTDHAGLEVLQHAPHAVDVLGEGVAGQAHAGVVGELDDLFLGLEPVQRQDGCEGLLARDEHVLGHVRDDGRFEEVAALVGDLVAAQDDVGAELARVLDLGEGLVDTAGRGDGAHGGALGGAVADDQLAGALLEHLRDLVVHAGLDVDAVGGHAGLAGVAPLEGHELVDGLVEVGVVEDDEGAVTAQLEGDLLQSLGAVGGDQLADAGGTGEGDLLDERVLAERLAQGRGVLQVGGQDVEDPGRDAGLLGQVRQDQSREGRLRAGLDDHGASRREGRASLAEDHRDGEVPGDQGSRNADGLLHGEDTPVGSSGHRDASVDSLRLTGEPPGEAGGVVNLSVRLSDGLARLVGQDLGQILLGVADEGVPFQEPLRALAGSHLAVLLEGRVGDLDGARDILSGVGRAAGPGLVSTGVCGGPLSVHYTPLMTSLSYIGCLPTTSKRPPLEAWTHSLLTNESKCRSSGSSSWTGQQVSWKDRFRSERMYKHHNRCGKDGECHCRWHSQSKV